MSANAGKAQAPDYRTRSQRAMFDYNTVRPHSAIGNMPPADFAEAQRAPATRRGGSLRSLGGFAPYPPLHHPPRKAQMRNGLSSALDESAQVTKARPRSTAAVLKRVSRVSLPIVIGILSVHR